jgi:DNA processing protein
MMDEVADPGPLPAEAFATALAGLDGMGPRRLRAVLDHHPTVAEAWSAVAAGHLHRAPELRHALGPKAVELAAGWVRQASAIDVGEVWHRHIDAGVGVTLRRGAAYPDVFERDLEPPAIVFHCGDPDAVVGSRVAIVGTRDCTRYGHEVAFELGADLARAGVAVVSGLALGIDGAAHAGALEAHAAPPIAVVGSGLDVVYPRRNRELWREVARRGVIWSEYPLGTAALAWHFPARNRLIAALADVLVVVESHRHGGALITAEMALDRQRPVLAVPGPVRSPASAGANNLLVESGRAGVARDVTDVLVALGLEPGSRRQARERRAPPAPVDRLLLDAIGWQPVTLEQLAGRTGRPLVDVASGLTRLGFEGWVAERGGWYERVAKPGE